MEALEQATSLMLAPEGIETAELERILGQLSGRDIDYADLYFEHTESEAWTLDDNIVKEGSRSIDHGVGVRAVSGQRTGFAYADEIVLPALTSAAGAARAITRSGGSGGVSLSDQRGGERRYAPIDPAASLEDAEKVALLMRLNERARAADPRVQEVMVSLTGRLSTILTTAADGTLAADIRPLIRLNVNVVTVDGNRRESAGYGGGGRVGYQWLLEQGRAEHVVDEAVRQALVNLDARPAPAGNMTVVLGPGWPGILLHEAIGHGLEGDFNRKGTSAFAGRIGEMVADPQCTVVDDGTLADRRGSLSVDDEGTPTACTVLIENGRLAGYMQDKHNASLMGVAPTGNGRRQSYSHLPMPRMTNTYMRAGEHDPEAIIRSVDKGLYAVSFGGGQVDITSGKFVFSASEAYLIEGGRITAPVKGATLIGNGPEVLTRVSMVGDDLQLDNGVGTCGKEGQSVPVGVGQPTLRIDGLTVGGTDAG